MFSHSMATGNQELQLPFDKSSVVDHQGILQQAILVLTHPLTCCTIKTIIIIIITMQHPYKLMVPIYYITPNLMGPYDYHQPRVTNSGAAQPILKWSGQEVGVVNMEWTHLQSKPTSQHTKICQPPAYWKDQLD